MCFKKSVVITKKVSVLITISLFLLITSLSHLPLQKVFADSEQTNTYTSDSDFKQGTFNNTGIQGTGNSSSVSLCTGAIGCDHYYRPVTIDNTGGSQINSAFVQMTINTQ